MRAVLGMFDRFWLLACVLAAGCVPGFVLQYRQRMLGRLDQVVADLAPWRMIADRLHGGSMESLIAHHRASADPTFTAEADAIDAMVQAEGQLRATIEALQGNLFEQFYGLILHLDAADAEAVLSLYQPTFALDPEGLGFALLLGAVLWVLPVGMLGAARRLMVRRHARNTQLERGA